MTWCPPFEHRERWGNHFCDSFGRKADQPANLLVEVLERFGNATNLRYIGYVVMPEHFHVLAPRQRQHQKWVDGYWVVESVQQILNRKGREDCAKRAKNAGLGVRTMHGSLVGIPSRCEGIRFLRMTSVAGRTECAGSLGWRAALAWTAEGGCPYMGGGEWK